MRRRLRRSRIVKPRHIRRPHADQEYDEFSPHQPFDELTDLEIEFICAAPAKVSE